MSQLNSLRVTRVGSLLYPFEARCERFVRRDFLVVIKSVYNSGE